VHLGLIGGIGPAATEFYYRGLVARYAGAAKPMELTIVHADARELSQNAAVGDAQKQAQIFLALVRRLF
jgi:aspartate racemase